MLVTENSSACACYRVLLNLREGKFDEKNEEIHKYA